MKKSYFYVLAAASFSLLSFCAQASQSLVNAQSNIGFTFKQMNVPVEGHFKRMDAQINFDPKKPEKTKAQITIDLNSIDVGDATGNQTTQGKDFFNVASTPKATFVASSVKALGGNQFEARGRLSIKGISRDVVVQLSSKSIGTNLLQLDGHFPIQRLQFHVGEGDWADTGTLADQVLIKFKLVLSGTPQ